MTSQVERYLYNGRSIRAYDDENDDRVAGWPEVAYEAIRGINHVTGGPEPIPAPVVYDVLGNLKGVGHMLPQALDQLGRGLTASLEAFDVYDHKADPAESVAQAVDAMRAAAEHARQLGLLLEQAQGAINSQGYNEPGE